VTDSSHLVVFLYKEKMDADHIQKHISRVAEVRGLPESALEGYKTMMLQNLVENPTKNDMGAWAQRQAYIAMGFLMETAALLKIDACPMEGFDSRAYDKILELEGTGWRSVATVALGYRHPEDAMQNSKKVRFSNEDLIKYIR
jgi:nitroreductase